MEYKIIMKNAVLIYYQEIDNIITISSTIIYLK
jgi:hypothetical protein